MADHSNEGSSSSGISGQSATSIIELNIKTLDSHIYSFKVNKDMPVHLFKEKIANEIGIPVNQQRLIFRGKVLKDDHPLSEYHLENGHTLHLVERQPTQHQASSDTIIGDRPGNASSEVGTGAPRNRVGQIAHSVVLGTFNVGDQGEGIVPDLSRVIGAVLNSIGINNQNVNNGATGMQSTLQNNRGPTSQGNETFRVNIGGGGQAAGQSQTGQGFLNQPLQTFPHVIQIPLASAAVSVPSFQAPIPDSLATISEFMTRMEHSISQNAGDVPRVELPSNSQGLPTAESLSIVLRHAQRLLSDYVSSSLSHIAERLEQDSSSTDPTVRGQIQEESVQVGLRMQQFGALLLELGRTILTLRMGQSSAESVVNAGPAVYISPTGPNPIMVQPFPLQTNSLLGGSVLPSNPVAVGAVGIGTAPRHINIHIHAVGTRSSNGEGTPAENNSAHGSNDSGVARAPPGRSVNETAVPHPVGLSSSPATQSDQSSDSVSLSSIIADVNSQIRDLVGNVEGQVDTAVENSSVHSGTGGEQHSIMKGNGGGASSESLPGSILGSGSEKILNNPASICQGTGRAVNSPDISTCSSGRNTGSVESNEENSPNQLSCEKSSGAGSVQAAPLGLGLGGLERRRRGRQQSSQVKRGDSEGSTDRTQQLLQSLASASINRSNTNETSSGLQTTVSPTMDNSSLHGPSLSSQIDLASSMSQVLQNPALNGLLTGITEQTGVGSPDVLRNMLQQLTQNPQMRNTVNQIVQQVDTREIENMFAGSGGGQGGGLDLSRMFQQMMPVMSQVLGGGPRLPPASNMETIPMPHHERSGRGVETPSDQTVQIGIQELARRISSTDSPREVFRAVVEGSTQVLGDSCEDIMKEVCSDDELAKEYVEMLSRDVNRRFQRNSDSSQK